MRFQDFPFEKQTGCVAMPQSAAIKTLDSSLGARALPNCVSEGSHLSEASPRASDLSVAQLVGTRQTRIAPTRTMNAHFSGIAGRPVVLLGENHCVNARANAA